MGHTLGNVGNAIGTAGNQVFGTGANTLVSNVGNAINAGGHFFTGDLPTAVSKFGENAFSGWSMAPNGGSGGGSNPSSTPSAPTTLTTPSSSTAPSTAATPTASGAATPVTQMSGAMKSAIDAGAIGQLPGLIKSDVGSGMTGISPSYLANQASYASGFTSEQPYIQQLVQQYLQSNPNQNVS